MAVSYTHLKVLSKDTLKNKKLNNENILTSYGNSVYTVYIIYIQYIHRKR